MGKTQVESQDKRRQSRGLHQVLELQTRKCKTEANGLVGLSEVDNLQGIYPLKDEWVFGCSLKTRLADQTKTQQLKWLWSKDSMKSTINQRLVEQTQEINFKLEGSGGSTLGDTLRKQYLSSSDE